MKFPQNQGISKFIPIRYPTPLVYAICCEQVEIVKLLIQIGADLNLAVSNWKPIHYACLSQKIDMIKIIIEKDRNQLNTLVNGTNSTPLHIAVSSNNYLGTLVLLKLGADIKIKNTDNNSVIHLASISTDSRIIDVLVAYGAILDEKNNKEQTPEELAIKRHKVDNAKLLSDYASGKLKRQPVEGFDISSSPDPTADDDDSPIEEDTKARIIDLEERVATLEVILNN